jgi:hypothetical protein
MSVGCRRSVGYIRKFRGRAGFGLMSRGGEERFPKILRVLIVRRFLRSGPRSPTRCRCCSNVRVGRPL